MGSPIIQAAITGKGSLQNSTYITAYMSNTEEPYQ